MASQKPTLHFALALHLQLYSVSVHLCFQSSSNSRPATRSFVTQAAVPEPTVIGGGELERPDINVAKVVRVMVAISHGRRKAFFSRVRLKEWPDCQPTDIRNPEPR